MLNYFPSRYFNNVWHDETSGNVIKLSSDIDKLEKEYQYYMSLPRLLSQFFIEPVSFNKHGTYAILETKYINAVPISDMPFTDYYSWHRIFHRLHEMRSVFDNYSKENPNQIQHRFYVQKTMDRLEQYYGTVYWGRSTEDLKYITVNEVKIPNWRVISEEVIDYIYSINIPQLHLIHGDWCFSNILEKTYGSDLILVDPRGEFGDEIIYGDRMYDIAKLYHSVHGMYDYIVSDKIKNTHNVINGAMSVSYDTSVTTPTEILDLFHEKFPVDRKYLLILEGMLFLSMCSLHKENASRNIFMYARGLEILNTGLQL